ncbi:MAG: DNA translocase FtsK 4TM domain-containing protein [Candidatus Cloacimonetes bacterium]|nr:DNA translocase FtsK 4TM domain-containing protein [Candidatus Cloacimonadota bacterium]MBS3768001.1 DNA translocase FtsK 4TM domain-containing protein [Candidatus Cloacimonadota bacterium]
MTRKKKDKTEKKETSAKIVLGLLFMALGLLLFFSLVSFSPDDIVTLQNSNLGIYKIITLQFPEYLSNMIGPFGAFLSYGFIYLFSKLFSLVLAAYLFISGIITLFTKKLYKVSNKILVVLLLIFFANLFYVSVGGNFFLSEGVESGIVFKFIVQKVFFPVFSSLGSAIIFGVAFLGSALFLIGLDNLRIFFEKLWQLLKTKPKKKKKSRKSQKTKKPSISYLEEDKKKKKTTTKKQQEIFEEEESKGGGESTVFPTTDSGDYVFPDCTKILKSSDQLSDKELSQKKEKIQENSEILISKLNEFGVEGEVTNVNVGPIITQYEVRPAPGIKISKIANLSNDIALALKAEKIRIVAPIPGKSTIGFEVPNDNSTIIRLRDVLDSSEMKKSKSPTMIALGKSITGKPFVTDLKNLRHLLIAGLTGSGKSVCLNAIITSILCRAKPEQVRFILFDPKKIELSIYEKIPHLIKEVITDPKDVLYLLRWAVKEMERRYDVFAKHNVRNITDYHNMLEEFEPQEEEEELDKLPFIIVIVDELADLMQSLAKDIEKPLRRLSGMARAVGIYLVFATQRPSVDVVNGMIKANFPSRISFQVYSKTDSRTVLDINGAEKLLGAGDMLFSPLGKKPPVRVHGSFISTKEVKKVVKNLSKYEKPELDISLPSDKKEQLNVDYDDELFPEAVKIVVKKQYASVSMLQRRFRIGYARAGRLINQMEEAGIVGGSEGSKARKVLAKKSELSELGF